MNVAVSITGQDRSATGCDSFHLSPQGIDSGVVGDDQIGAAAFLVARPLGLLASLERLRATSRAALARGASALHAGRRRKRSDRTDRPSRPRAGSPRRARPGDLPHRPCRSLALDPVEKPGPHPRMKNRLQIPPCFWIGEHDRTQRLAIDRRRRPGSIAPAPASTPAPNRSTIRLPHRGIFQELVPHCVGIDHHGSPLFQ